MARITPVEPDHGTDQQKRALGALSELWSQPWQVAQTIANSPNMITTFQGLWTQLQESSLSRDDREVIALHLVWANGSHYCVPAHTKICREKNMPENDIVAILEDREPTDKRRRLILDALRAIQATKGGLSGAQFNKFTKAGLSPENLIDIIGEIAHCTITNYTNRLAQTELDDFLKAVPPATTPKGMDEPEIKKYPLRPPKSVKWQAAVVHLNSSKVRS
jgi:uncharacterized peroxidase-related enzyme